MTPAARSRQENARRRDEDAAARDRARADADLVERELPTYADREEVTLTAAALRELLGRSRRSAAGAGCAR